MSALDELRETTERLLYYALKVSAMVDRLEASQPPGVRASVEWRKLAWRKPYGGAEAFEPEGHPPGFYYVRDGFELQSKHGESWRDTHLRTVDRFLRCALADEPIGTPVRFGDFTYRLVRK